MEIYTINGPPVFGEGACPPGWVATPNGYCGGPPPRYYHEAAAAVQRGLRTLGARVGDPVLTAVQVDGIVGPGTVAAVNRAFTQHIGEGQAPANFRTGALAAKDVAENALNLAIRLNEEVLRRGGAPVAVPSTEQVAQKNYAVSVETAQILSSGGPPKALWALVGLGALGLGVGLYLTLSDS